MVRRIASLLSLIDLLDGREVQLIDEIAYEVRQMSLRKPALEGWWQQVHLIWAARPACLAHTMMIRYVALHVTHIAG